jgi:hypothetical protein
VTEEKSNEQGENLFMVNISEGVDELTDGLCPESSLEIGLLTINCMKKAACAIELRVGVI